MLPFQFSAYKKDMNYLNASASSSKMKEAVEETVSDPTQKLFLLFYRLFSCSFFSLSRHVHPGLAAEEVAKGEMKREVSWTIFSTTPS
jgi:hypothetical protein